MVDIKSLEHTFKFILCQEFTSVHGSQEPLTVGDSSILVFIGHLDKTVNLTLIKVVAINHTVTLKQFLFGKSSRTISIELIESFIKLLSFLLSHEVLDHETKGGLLQFITRIELPEIIKSSMDL